jgi:hypothetical protein
MEDANARAYLVRSSPVHPQRGPIWIVVVKRTEAEGARPVERVVVIDAVTGQLLQGRDE